MEVDHPDQMYWIDAQITKAAYASYLTAAAPLFLADTKDRLLMIWLYPHGVDGKRIEKRTLPASAPSYVCRKRYKGKMRMVLNDTATLHWALNYGAVEFHVPFDTISRTGFPTLLFFDLDRANQLPFSAVLECAQHLKKVLDGLGLISTVKFSGKTGLHVGVPLNPVYLFEQARPIQAFVARYVVEKIPGLFTIERNKSKRRNKVYFDYLQLWKGRSMVVPYSARAVPHAAVSAPVSWERIEQGAEPEHYTISTVRERLNKEARRFSVAEEEKVQNTEIAGTIIDFLVSRR
ncbi:MAG TPA: DNA polymerase domain-containing protein [Bacillales bacterium]|nr:DNA polymerase domain-containing protein [Bacillales bacterium]